MPKSTPAEKPAPTRFGQKLKELRQAAGLSQAALAAAVGIGRVAVAKLESSPGANPTLDTMQKLAAALGVTVGQLADAG